MKYLPLLALLLLSIYGQPLAQISSGGTPLSFSQTLDEAIPTLEMPYVDVEAYLAEDEADGWSKAFRIGAPHDLTINPNTSGIWTDLREGRLWRCRIYSAGAYALSLQFDRYSLPQGAKLFIYNDDHSHVIGAFTDRNNKTDGRLGTQPVKGEAIILEYFEPSTVAGNGELSIWRVVHVYRNLFQKSALDEFGGSAWCAVNINCPEGENWQDQKRGVALIFGDGGTRICTGSLINNARNDGTPYFNTALHCTVGGDVGAWVFVFNYESHGCESVDGRLDQSISSGTLLMTNADSDFALIELSERIPTEYNPYFSGWNAVDIPPTSSVCISHPSGDIKKIAIDNDPAEHAPFFDTPDSSHWRINEFEIGDAEPGSSGAPLFNQDGLIIGQVHGGDGWCENVPHNVHFGKTVLSLAAGADRWLDPDNTGVLVLQGLDLANSGRISGTVRDAVTLEPVADVNVSMTDGTEYSTTDESGGFAFRYLENGFYGLRFSKWGYVDYEENGIVVRQDETTVRDISFEPATIITILNEDFEDGAPGWTHASTGGSWIDQWHLSTESAHSESHAFKCGDFGGGNYAARLDARLVSPVLDSVPPNAILSFWMRIQSEASSTYPDSAYDGGILEVLVDGEYEQFNPDGLYSHFFKTVTSSGAPATGPMPSRPCMASLTLTDWTYKTIDFSEYEGQSICLAFRFGSDAVINREGWYIDDIVLQGATDVPPAVTGLVVYIQGNDVILTWDDDATPYYKIYSSSSPEIPFPTWEGTTDQTSFTIENGLLDPKSFYYVVGTRGN